MNYLLLIKSVSFCNTSLNQPFSICRNTNRVFFRNQTYFEVLQPEALQNQWALQKTEGRGVYDGR